MVIRFRAVLTMLTILWLVFGNNNIAKTTVPTIEKKTEKSFQNKKKSTLEILKLTNKDKDINCGSPHSISTPIDIPKRSL